MIYKIQGMFGITFAKFYCSTVLLLFSFFCKGQETEKLSEMQALYPSEPVLVLNRSEHLEVGVKKGKIVLDIKVKEKQLYLNDQADLYADHQLYFGAFRKIKKVKAYSLIPKKGRKYKKEKVRTFDTSSVNTPGIFFDDQQQLSFRFPGLKKGAISELSYAQQLENPMFLGRNFFSFGLPCLKSKITITFPQEVEIGYRLMNADPTLIKFTKLQKGKNITYQWEGKNLPVQRSFSDGPELSFLVPHVVIYLKKIQLKDTTVEVLPDLSALYRWYHSLVKGVNAKPNESLKNRVDSLLQGVNSEDEKAKLIYYWVQDHIKYVAFEDGMGGFVPRDAALVCNRRFGDCKDMSSLLVEMLKYAGISAHLTWLGTRDLPYKYTQIHTPVVDNHMIASYQNEKNQTVFLDAVGSYTPFGLTTEMIQGKEALIGCTADSFRVANVPIVSKERNCKKDKVKLLFKDGELMGEGRIKARGYSKLSFVYPLIDLNTKKRNEKLTQILNKGSNKFIIQKANYEGMKNRDAELDIFYDFSLKNYATFYGKELYVNLLLDKSWRDEKIDTAERRQVPLTFEHTLLDTFEVSITIPKNYELKHLPPNVKHQGKNFGFSLKYLQSIDTVKVQVIHYNDLLLLKPEQFNEWNKMIDKIKLAYQENIVLHKS